MNVNFDLAQIITIVSVLLVVIGWFVNQWLNRKNEIAKERRKYRLDMLHSIIEFRNYWVKTKKFNQDLYDTTYCKIQLYGKNDEISLFEQLRKDMEEKKVVEVVEKSLIKIVLLSRDRIRKELKLEKAE